MCPFPIVHRIPTHTSTSTVYCGCQSSRESCVHLALYFNIIFISSSNNSSSRTGGSSSRRSSSSSNKIEIGHLNVNIYTRNDSRVSLTYSITTIPITRFNILFQYLYSSFKYFLYSSNNSHTKTVIRFQSVFRLGV